MKSFQRVKKIHGRDYLYEVTPYYDRTSKKIKQRSRYIGIAKDGKPVASSVRTYSYGDLVPVMKVVRDLNMHDLLRNIAPDYADLILVCAINRILRPESMNNLAAWFEDTYLSAVFDLDMKSQKLSRAMSDIGRMDLNHAYLPLILHMTGKTGALFYDLTSFSSHSRNMEFLEYGYSRSDPDLPQVNVSMIADRSSGLPIFYDIYPGSVVDVTTVLSSVEILRSAGISDITLIMDRGMFSSGNIEKLLSLNEPPGSAKIGFIMPATFTLKEVKRISLLSRRTIERGSNLIRIGEEIMFAEQRDLNISGNPVKAWIYYQPDRDRIERAEFYGTLYDRIGKLRDRKLRRYEEPSETAAEIMGPYAHFISWKYDSAFSISIRENALSQRVNRCGITVITFLGSFDSSDTISMYRERDAVEKLFLQSKSFLEAEPLRVHGMDALKGRMFLNMIALALRSRMLRIMKDSRLLEEYSVEKMLLELHKIRKVKLQNGREITTEITKKQREILEKFSIPVDHVPTFLRS